MAKNRNKKNKAKRGGAGVAAMDTSEGAPAASTAADAPQPMDTTEGKQPSSSASAALSSINRKIKKGMQIKRTQSVRKMKAIARAISKNEKAEEKVLKDKSKKTRVQSAKSLYD